MLIDINDIPFFLTEDGAVIAYKADIEALADRRCDMDKIRPTTEIFRNRNEDGSRTWDEIRYFCPTCGSSIGSYKSDNACDKCGTFYDWGDSEPQIKIKKEVVWR